MMDANPFLFLDKSALTDEFLKFAEENPTLTVISVSSYSFSSDNDLQNVLFVKKPLSAMMIASIYNNEEYIEEHVGDVLYDFMAETARVLIVDDNMVNLTVAEGLLEPLGMEIDTAMGGREAIKKISEKMYDLILMDHMMPEIDGVETTHMIRELHQEYENVPIIALTANAVGGAKNMFLEEGMNDFIAKPIEVHVLISKMKQWLPKNKITKGVKNTAHAQNTLPQIEGIDSAAAIKMIGSEKVFWSVLKDYHRLIPQKLEAIKKYFATEDWRNYTIEVHALKSSSRQIGATGLAQKAELLETAGNARDIETIKADTQAALDEYEHYYEILNPYFIEEKNEATEEITRDILYEVFDEIQNAIEELDTDMLEEAVQKLSVYKLSDVGSQYYNRMLSAVEDMDAYACEDIMTEWKGIL